MAIVGTNDEVGSDDTVYDHVVIAADVGAVQSIFKETLKNYQNDAQISKVIGNCLDNNIGIL